MIRRRLVLVSLLALLAPAPLRAAAPAAVREALQAWQKAVRSGDPAQLGRLVPEGEKVVVRLGPHPKLPSLLRLGGADLIRHLQGGDGPALGLHRAALLPEPKDLRKDRQGRYQASNPRCPEVTWIFTQAKDRRWVLSEIVRKFLEC